MSRLVAAGATLVLLSGLGVVAVQSRDREEPLSEQAAVDAFRAAAAVPGATPSAEPSPVPAVSPAAAAPPPVLPGSAAPAPAPGDAPDPTRSVAAAAAPVQQRRDVEPGVYRYATEGHEEVDLLGGARHDYPDSTTITYSRTGCGTEERWQPLEGRVGVTTQCDGPGGSELRGTYQEREFFGQRQSAAYTCRPGVLVRPREPRPGRTWTGRCRADDSTIDLTVRVVALERLDVGGTAVPTVRVRLAGVLTGSTRGRSDRELWLRLEDGLLVQATGDTDTDADTPGGTVRYRETYRLRLQSLTPRR